MKNYEIKLINFLQKVNELKINNLWYVSPHACSSFFLALFYYFLPRDRVRARLQTTLPNETGYAKRDELIIFG